MGCGHLDAAAAGQLELLLQALVLVCCPLLLELLLLLRMIVHRCRSKSLYALQELCGTRLWYAAAWRG
jgi:hypothetical protein